MPLFEVLESKLVYRDPNNRWYLSAQLLQDTGKIYYVLTHSSNEREQKVFMSQFAAEDLQEFLRHWPEQASRNGPPVSIEQATGTFLYFMFFFYLIYEPESLLYVSLAEAEHEEPPAKKPLKERDPNQENLENKCKAEEHAKAGN